jgi:hypothetical protein
MSLMLMIYASMKNGKDINILRLTDIQDKTKDFMLSLLAEIYQQMPGDQINQN